MIPASINHNFLGDGIPSDYIARYTYDNISGSTVFDESQYGNDATLINSPTVAAGEIKNGVYWNGSNQRMDLPNTLLHRNEMAIATWVYFEAGERCQIACAADNGDTDKYVALQLNVFGGGEIRLNQSTNGPVYDLRTDDGLTADDWHHVVVQSAPGDTAPEIWVDNELQATTVFAGTYDDEFFNAPSDLDNSTLGALMRSNPSYREGGHDETFVYPRKLTAKEIRALYNQKAGQ